MNKFVRWYNQNRKTVFVIAFIIALFIIIIQVLNSIVKTQNEQKRNNANNGNSSTNTSTTISEPNTSVITGEKVPKNDNKANLNVIKEFIEYCNNGQIDKAYNMLTNECKELIYPSLEYFNNNYYKKIFYINRMYSLENWYSDMGLYTYYVKYTEDVLASGNVNSSDNKGDYITVVKSEEGYKLNISNYVGRQGKERARVKTREYGTITINWIDMYMDYTIANISIKNNSNNTICLDTKKDIDTMYMYDENAVRYTSFLNEIAQEQLIIRKGMTNTINIKFNKIYNPEREISGIVFSDVVLNYDNYISKVENKKKDLVNLEI